MTRAVLNAGSALSTPGDRIPPPPSDDTPDILLGYQAEAIRLSEQSPFLLIEKSRRTGITYGFAALAVLEASPRLRPQNVYYIAYNLDMTREFIGYCAEFAKAFDEVASETSEILFDDGSEKGIKALRIDFPSGKAIVALSSRPRSLRGMQGLVIIDEAAFHEEFEELLKAAMALTMWGGRVVVISTHNGADNAFATTIDKVREGKIEGTVLRITLEDALRDGLYRRICLRTGETWTPAGEIEWERALRKRYGDAADEELDVIPGRGSGTYLTSTAIQAAMTPDHRVVRLTCPVGFELLDREARQAFVQDWLEETVDPVLARFDPTRRSFFGQDFARSSDLSVVALGQIDALAILQVPLMIEMRNVPFREQKLVLDHCTGGMPLFSAGKMDGRGNGQQLAEDMASDWGFDRIEAVMATAKTYLAYMPPLKASIEDRTMRIPENEGVKDDLRLIKLVKGVPQVIDRSADKADGAKGKRHGDGAIALMHLRAAANDDVGPIDVHTLARRRAGAGEFTHTTRGFGTISRRASTGDY